MFYVPSLAAIEMNSSNKDVEVSNVRRNYEEHLNRLNIGLAIAVNLIDLLGLNALENRQRRSMAFGGRETAKEIFLF